MVGNAARVIFNRHEVTTRLSITLHAAVDALPSSPNEVSAVKFVASLR
jgi:hypothetical protein